MLLLICRRTIGSMRAKEHRERALAGSKTRVKEEEKKSRAEAGQAVWGKAMTPQGRAAGSTAGRLQQVPGGGAA